MPVRAVVVTCGAGCEMGRRRILPRRPAVDEGTSIMCVPPPALRVARTDASVG